MKLNEFVKMFKKCNLLNEQATPKCFGKARHNKTFEEAVSLIYAYAAKHNLANASFPTGISNMKVDGEKLANALLNNDQEYLASAQQALDSECSPELVTIIKAVQADLGLEDDGVMGFRTLGAVEASLQGKLAPKKNVAKKPAKVSPAGPILIVGDSIATGMTVAAANQGIINQPQCKGSWYGKCETAVAKGGLTALQIKARLSSYLASPQSKSAKPGKLILSAGTNDAIAYAKGVGNYTPQKTSALIDQIVGMATGYQVIVKTIGPVNPATKTGKNTNFVTKYNEFAGEVNKHIQSKYKTFSGAEVPFAANDFIHPSKAGSAQLLARAISGTPAPAAPVKPVTSTDKDSLIVVGDSNANYIAKKWLGVSRSSVNLERPGYPKKIFHLLDKDTKTPLAPQISGGQVSHILRSTKEFYELKGENYKPTTAIVHMGYNGSSDGQLKAFKDTIDFLKSKGVSDIRVIQVKVDSTKMNKSFGKIMTTRAKRVNDLIDSLSGITIIPNQGDNRSDGYHFTQGGYQTIYGAAMSGVSAPAKKAVSTQKTRKNQIDKPAGKGFPSFISSASRGSTIRVLSPFGTFSEVMDSVSKLFKEAAKKVNLRISEDPTIQDLRNLQSKLGISADGSFGPTSMAAISLINSKYSNVVSENKTNAINLKSHLTESFREIMEQSIGNLSDQSKFGKIDPNVYIEQYASRASLQKAYSGAVKKKLNITKPPMNNKYAKKDTSWREDKEFLRAIKEYSDKNGVDPKVFLAIMAHETGGTFSPYMVNHLGCTGLIQFCPTSGMKDIGKNQQQLTAMTRLEQWKMVEKFYNKTKRRWANSGADFARMYLITFSPAYATLPDDAVIYAKDPSRAHPYVRKVSSSSFITKAWKENPANRDPKDQTVIRKKSMGDKVKAQVRKFNITDDLFEV